MNNKIEGIFSMLSAILVIFTAMLDPRVSIFLAVALLLAMSVYKFTRAKKEL